MLEPTITCPNCSTEIPLSESLAGPLIAATRKEYEDRLSSQRTEIAAREENVKAQAKALEESRLEIEALVESRVTMERSAIVEREAAKAKAVVAAELENNSNQLRELEQILKQRDEKLQVAQAAQADVLRQQRELSDAKRELDLTIEKRVNDSIAEVRARAKLEAEDALKLKVAEKEEQISAMQRQIEILKQRAEQGSQQLQGEALEIELESLIRSKYPFDITAPIAKGEFGADVLQTVIGPTGQQCGSILWELKRTRNWNDGWLAKLRQDQRNAKAEIAVLVSQALPKNVDNFDLIDGVWVTTQRTAIPLVTALRLAMIDLANAKMIRQGQGSKMELVYEYLTGPRFRHRVEAIVEKFSEMQSDLDRERKAMTRMWAKREAQIQGVISSTVGMYGDLQGIAGQVFQEIQGLELDLLEVDDEKDVE